MTDRPLNAFLRSLGADSFDALSRDLVRVNLRLGEILYRPEERVDWVYFPESCLLSLLTMTADGESVETAMSGNEGGGGVLEVCGSGVSSVTSLVQIDGVAWRAPAAAFRTLVANDEDVSRKAWTLTEFQMTESRQSGLCQALHSVEPRLARWLVDSMERSGGRNPMPLTQEFIGAMLGVQRTTVTAFAGQLQKAGLIQYQRGRVEITDIAGLEARACECREALVHQRRRMKLEPLASADSERRTSP